jgi:uncharacterized membrane protein
MSKRLESIDAVRGAVMVIMALDHVRDFIHHDAMLYQPTDLTKASAFLFVTRWITHFCAPTFMLTAGLGAWFWGQREGRTRGDLSRFLVTRGLWLMLLEITVMRLAYNFSFSFQYPVLLIVLWVLGLCMVVLGALVWLPLPILTGLSLAVIALHNLLDPIDPARFGAAAGLWNLLHRPGAFGLGGITFIVAYPLIPWAAVMALGFCLGPWYRLALEPRRRRLVVAGIASCVGFVLLRGLNVYGDPFPWSAQPSSGFSVLSFLNTTKYPPSLAFLLMTLGPALLALAWFERPLPRWANPLVVFGRVPLFYFVGHFFAAHLAAVLLGVARYGSGAARFALHPLPSMGGPADLYPPDFGFGLGVAYLVWAAIVLLMYPACRWFADFKARRSEWWVGYL